MKTTDIHSIKADSTFTKPYRKSWMDYLIDRIKRLRIKPWWFYLGLLLLVSIINNVILWIDGSLKAGDIHPLFTSTSIYTIYGIAFYHYLTHVAEHALHDFFPVLNESTQKEQELSYRMTMLPASWGWLALALGIVVGFFDVYSSQYDFITTWTSYVYAVVIGVINYGTIFAMMFLAAKQLSMVVKLHHQVSSIDLFNLAPLRAFSRLTAIAGLAVFFIGAISMVLFSEITDPSLLAFYFALLLIGVFIFVLPLISIRNRIRKEKKQKLLEVNQSIKHTLDQVSENIQAGELAKMGELNMTLSVLEKKKSILKGISSYPWSPGTLKSFFSTILLPLLIWWIKSFLDKWL